MAEEIQKKYLEEWRKERYWSQSELSKVSGVSQSIISRIEKGDKIGRFETMIKLAAALAIKPEQILDFAPSFSVKRDREATPSALPA
jgi:transcriptional regulator with XRE-family HTH domain